MSDEPIAYGVLIRRGGWKDCLAAREPKLNYGAYPNWDAQHSEPARFATEAEAAAHAALVLSQLDPAGFVPTRCEVVVERAVPRWFLLHPRCDRERRPVGSVEQL